MGPRGLRPSEGTRATPLSKPMSSGLPTIAFTAYPCTASDLRADPLTYARGFAGSSPQPPLDSGQLLRKARWSVHRQRVNGLTNCRKSIDGLRAYLVPGLAAFLYHTSLPARQ